MNRGRRRYNPVASNENGPDDNEDEDNEQPPRRNPRQYSRVAATDDKTEKEDEDCTASLHSTESQTGVAAKECANDEEIPLGDKNSMTVTVLDFAQTRFQVPASPTWTVGHFKQASAKIHKVSPDRQRLIFRGKLLGDDNKTLQEVGIVEDGVIVHLFPKPRVVITTDQNENSGSTGARAEGGGQEEEGGARIPTIIMDAAEAERRAEILVLGSTEFIETQNNVKLFSFMLLIICAIELLNLLGIAMGVPQQVDEDTYDVDPAPTDEVTIDFGSNGTAYGPYDAQDPATALYTQWGISQYVDTLISVMGVYVALIGLKASTENTLRLARIYMFGLVCTGVAWLIFNFYFMSAVEKKHEVYEEQKHYHEIHPDDDDFTSTISDQDIHQQVFQVLFLPSLVWMTCWIRAWYFQHLLHEAEQEASVRLQSQLSLDEDRGRPTSDRDQELALANNNRIVLV